MRLYHPQYEVKRDKVTRILFSPAKLDGRTVAAAEVSDAEQARDLQARGWLRWPGETDEAAPLPEDLEALTIAQVRELAADRGVELGARGTKAELIEALRDAVLGVSDDEAKADDAEAGAD